MEKLFVFAPVISLCAVGLAAAAPVDIAIDIDSSRLSGTDTTGPLNTQPGFTSWDLTTFTVSTTGPTITQQGTTFQIFGIGSNQSRVRVSGGVGAGDGTTNDDLTQDFLYHEGAAARAVGLRITGLDVGQYDMQSWHYDRAVMNTENFIQVEVRDQGVSGSTVLLVDKLPFGSTPASFSFEVTEPGQVKEIIFREDDAATETDTVDQNRARLNAFTLVAAVPEPSSALLLGLGAARLLTRRRRV